jgi:hypothetical protein
MTNVVSVLERPTQTQDPVRYNRGQLIQFPAVGSLYKPQATRDSELFEGKNLNVCFVDWFECQIVGQLPTIIEGQTDYELSDQLHLQLTGKQTKHFHHLFEVYLYGEHLGQLQTHTKAPKFFAPNSMQFKMDNHLLYTEDWLGYYAELLNTMGWNHNSLSRVDIGLDGQGAKAYKSEVIKTFSTRSKTKIVGKTRIKPSFVNGHVEHVEIGSRKSDKYGRIYNKTEELGQSNKTYISNYWKNSNLKSEDETWRLEIEMKSKQFKKGNYDLWRLNDANYLASILRTELKGWVSFYRETTDTNKHRAMKKNTKELIDWESIGGRLLERSEAKKPSDIFKAKATIKNLLRFKEVFGLNNAEELIEHFDLHEWYDSKALYWFEDNAKEAVRRKETESLRLTSLN